MLYSPSVLTILAGIIKNRLVLLAALIGASFLFSIHSSFALPASPGKVPNGNVFLCNTCHLPDPAPKSENTQMKLDFLNTTPPKTWTTDMANKDSDSDGFTNGEELQDFDGTWAIGQPDPGSTFYVSNPSVAGSVPAPPVASQVGNFFGSVASGSVSFFVIIDFHALPISQVEYTIRNSGGNTVFTDIATNPTPPFNYLSSAWDTMQVPNGSYTIAARVVEARKKPGVTPRNSEVSQTFTVHNASVSFSNSTYTADESSSSATLTVQLSEPATEFITVDYETSNGTAVAGQDYVATHGTLEFDVDESSKTISVPILDDNRDEPNETFTVNLFSPSGAVIGSPDTATVTIADDDPAPAVMFSSGGYSVGEAAGTATIGVQLNAPSNQQVTVRYATSNGTATTPGDYASKSGTLTFNPGQISKTFDITIVGDSQDEPDETVNLALSSPGSAILGAPSGAILTIQDDDGAQLPVVALSASDPSAAEAGPDSAAFTITRSGGTAQPLIVHYSAAGTATAGSDYAALTGAVTIPAGQASAMIVVTPIDDAGVEGSETVAVTLSADPAYTVGANVSATATIADDDTPTPIVTVSASDPSAAEAGLDSGAFTITRSGSAAAPLVVHYSASGTATGGADYTALTGAVTIPAGQASATIALVPIDDAKVEGSEIVIMTLSTDPAYALGASMSAAVTIADDDPAQAPQHQVYLPLVRR